jgi:release factor glutamine methyltransferase
MTARVGVNDLRGFWTLDSLMADIHARLHSAGIEAADREASWLIEHALGVTSLNRLIDRARPVSPSGMARVNEYVNRRAAREPLQYILGTQEFCGLDFEVNPAVLIPRPETELLVQEVIRRLPQGARPTVVDVGTGSGCMAVILARAVPDGRIVATDLSSQAMATARSNARRHGVETTITWLEGDLLSPLAGLDCEGRVTAIVANPPYIRESEWSALQPEVSRYEPRMALVAGKRGTEFHERLVDDALHYLAPGGLLAMEVGQGQAVDVCAKIEAMPGYQRAEIVPDEAGIDRIVLVARST